MHALIYRSIINCNIMQSTWLFRCVGVTDAAAAELSFLLYVELGCSAAAALAATLHMLLTTRTSRWAAAVDYQLAWVALAAAAGIHCMQVASDRIYLAADAGAGNPKHIRHIVEIVLMSLCLVADLLSGLLLCFSPRPRLAGDGEQV